MLLGAVLDSRIGVGVGQARLGRTGQAASGQSKTGQGFADGLHLALGIDVLRRVALGRDAQQQPAGQQGDDDQHDGQFDQREASVAVR